MSIAQTPSPLSNILAAKTYNAAWFSGATIEAQITAAIAAAVADGANAVYVPANMLPYATASVTFNSSIRMIREGGDASVYDVKAYGAYGDGVNNDRTAIQAALDACYTSGGGIVRVPPGTYGLLTGLVMPGSLNKSVFMVGDEMTSVKLVALAAGVTLIDHAGSSLVSQFTLDGNTFANVIAVDMNSNCRVDNLYIKRCLIGLDYVGNAAATVGVFYSKADYLYIDGTLLAGSRGIRMQTTGASAWVNSNQVFNAQIRQCEIGILLNGATSNTFHAMDLETNVQGIRIVSAGVAAGAATQGNRFYGNHTEKNPLAGTPYHVHIGNTSLTAGTLIHMNGLAGFTAEVNTTGTTAVGSPVVTVASVTNIENGKVLRVTGAGAAGVDLESEVIGVNAGLLQVTLQDNAGTLVAGAPVRGPVFSVQGTYELFGEQYKYYYGAGAIHQAIPFTQKPTFSGSNENIVNLDELVKLLSARGVLTNNTQFGTNSPAALGAGNNNDYAPGDYTTLRITSDAAGSVITGIANGSTGRRLRIMKVGGAGTLTISHQDAASAIANRIISPTGASVVMNTDDVVDLEYDASGTRWRVTNIQL